MKRLATVALAVGLLAWLATPALADEVTPGDIQSAVDTYLATAERDASLVGGPGSAGYDGGFWIKGGDFSLVINLTLQARFEFYNWDEDNDEPFPGGDLSGFSLPRALVKFSGTAPCNMRYYVELDFGHYGEDYVDWFWGDRDIDENLGPWGFQSYHGDNTREAWIEWGASDAMNFRMGQIRIPTTRQLMTPPELQQFVDISMASAFTGQLLPGYTDRPRDHGFMLHGAFGCNGEFSYMLAVTNGDGGDSIRNVLDIGTSDNLAYSARVNWAFLEPIGYQEGAVRQQSCVWYGELGAWAFYYADRQDKVHYAVSDALLLGADLALGYGGWTMTGAFTYANFSEPDNLFPDWDYLMWLVQMGYHIPDTAFEVVARYSHYELDIDGVGADPDGGIDEVAGGINYYLNGHGNKLQFDFTYLMPDSDVGGFFSDVYMGVPYVGTPDQDAFLIRFQWQLAL